MSKDIDRILSTLQRLAEPNGLITSDIEWATQQLELLIKRARVEGAIDELTEALQMNGAHPGDWEVAIHQRIAELAPQPKPVTPKGKK